MNEKQKTRYHVEAHIPKCGELMLSSIETEQFCERDFKRTCLLPPGSLFEIFKIKTYKPTQLNHNAEIRFFYSLNFRVVGSLQLREL